ncbi:MAG: glycoside hydrolase family 88 protein [Salinivirgaceae bacterium]
MNLLRIVFLLIAFSWLLSCSPEEGASVKKEGVFMVSYPHGYSQETETVYLNLSDLKQHYGLANFSNIQLVSMNNHKQVPYKLYDLNGDHSPELLGYILNINPKEPLRPFVFYTVAKKEEHPIEPLESYINNLKVIYLNSSLQKITDTLNWSKTVAKTFIDLYPDACNLEAFSPNEWTYTNGFFTNALCQLYERTYDTAYINYAQKWMDCFVDPEGKIATYNKEKYRLDDVLPGRTLLYLFQNTKEDKYKKAADTLATQLLNQPKTNHGGYWHKLSYPHQMWLDGVYMGDVFSSQYAAAFNKPEFYDEAVHQIELIYKHTVDSVTGLLYHGWDESINDVWADPVRGTSPEFWGRGMGWYMMALVDVLDYLPANHPERAKIITILNKTSEALAKVQDAKTHLWFQVLDKGSRPDNWIESSCSSMFGYAFAKGATKGYLPSEYLHKAEDAFNGLINDYTYFDSEGRFYLTETVYVGTLNFKNSDGSYNYYINVDRRINDFKGVAAFLYLAMALDK